MRCPTVAAPLPTAVLVSPSACLRLSLVLATLAVASPAGAQFRVVSSSPADGAAGVGLAVPLSFTFNAPVDAGVAPAIVTFPADSIAFGAPALSGDGLTLAYPSTRTATTRFVHLLLDARAADGAALERPYAVAYTTAPTSGGFSVSGTVTATAGSVDATLVVLAALAGAGVTVADAVVIDGSSGAYTLGPVPLGVYSVAAVRLPYAPTSRAFAYGIYDPDGDGVPNPVIIPFGVDLTISEPAPLLARARFDEAVAQALARAPDALFYDLLETPADTTGRSPIWQYAFYSPSSDSTITVVQTGLLPLVFARAGAPESLAQVFGTWVDSDVAMAAAEAAAGAAFRAAHAGEAQTLTIRAGLQPDVPTAATACYRVSYRAFDQAGTATDSLHVYVTMGSGVVVSPTAGEGGPDHPGLTLDAPAPNPASARVLFAYTLDSPAPTRVEVLDAAGRRVALVVDAPRAAGRHIATWNSPSTLAAGVYVVRLTAGGRTATRPLVITR